MSDNGEADSEEPAVPLGEGDPVEGAPTARITSRLYFPIEESEVLRREGDTAIRTPDGPRELDDVLAESDEVYFPDRQSFVDTVEDVVGTGPVPTAGEDETAGDAAATGNRPGDVEPDNAAEAPEGEDSPDEDNAAEAAEDGDEGDAVDRHEAALEDEGEFQFDNPEE